METRATITRRASASPGMQPSQNAPHSAWAARRNRAAWGSSAYARTIPSGSPKPWPAASPIPLQCKLAVGAVDDPLEREADAIATQVLAASIPAAPSSGTGFPALRRKCACGGSGEPCKKCKEEKKGVLQRKTAEAQAPVDAPAEVHEVLGSPGQPLDAAIRSFMEPRFGRNFGDVRVHTDSKAHESARSISALAYASGRHLVFGAGQYAPHSTAGRSLIAHELVHVLQQGGHTGGAAVRRQPDPRVHASQTSTAPYEKSAPEVEAMYRRAGLVDAANAVARCRQGDCSKVLTEDEAYRAYRTGRVSAGLGQSPQKESKASVPPAAAAAAPVAGLAAPVVAPGTSSATGAAAKTALERAAERWGTAEVIEGGAAAPTAAPGAAAAGTVAVPIALGIYLVVATVDLVGYASFQSALQRQGYVILPHPLGVCVAGCHQPSAPTLSPTSPFPPLPSLPPLDEKALLEWLQPTPTEASRNSPTPSPQTTSPPVPATPAPPPKSTKCTDEMVDQIHDAMKKLCNQNRSCSMQGDTCASATAKVSAGYACIAARENMQKKCFSPGDPGYEGHMRQIAQAYAALRECKQVMAAKCK